jgi:hypothetical protein
MACLICYIINYNISLLHKYLIPFPLQMVSDTKILTSDSNSTISHLLESSVFLYRETNILFVV